MKADGRGGEDYGNCDQYLLRRFSWRCALDGCDWCYVSACY